MLGTIPYLIQVVKSGEVHRSPVYLLFHLTDLTQVVSLFCACMAKESEEMKQDSKDFCASSVGIMVESFLLIFLQEHFVSKAVQALYFKEERLHNLKIKMDNILTELVHLTRNFEEI